MSVQLCDFESALKYFIKCIEILEDLYSTFHITEIDRKYKTKMHFLHIANRLSKIFFITATYTTQAHHFEASFRFKKYFKIYDR